MTRNSTVPSKDWMNLPRYEQEYINGVKYFLDFAFTYGEFSVHVIGVAMFVGGKVVLIRNDRPEIIIDEADVAAEGFLAQQLQVESEDEFEDKFKDEFEDESEDESKEESEDDFDDEP